MRSRNIRLLTGRAVIGICLWPVWQGFNVIRYVVADSKPEALRPWRTVPGVAFSARDDALTPIDNFSDDKRSANDATKSSTCSGSGKRCHQKSQRRAIALVTRQI